MQYFRTGFERMVNTSILKASLDSEELQALICGQQELNFKDLQETVHYGGGFAPETIQIKWFWVIVLDEFDDEKRRRFLNFSTGSNRAPIAGLKSLKFYIIQEGGDDDQKLPSSHTCFN